MTEIDKILWRLRLRLALQNARQWVIDFFFERDYSFVELLFIMWGINAWHDKDVPWWIATGLIISGLVIGNIAQRWVKK